MPARKSPKKKNSIKKTNANGTGRKKVAVKKSKGIKSAPKKPAPGKKTKKKRVDNNSAYLLNTNLPERYNKTYLRVLPKDPNWLFVYWEISEETIDTAINKTGIEQFKAAKPILRLLDITDIEYNGTNAWKYFDVHVHYYANNWYVKVPEPGRTYIVEYGNITSGVTFFPMMQSNVVKTPRDNYSEIIDEKWSTAGTKELTRFSINYPEESYGGASGSLLQTPSFLGSSENTPTDSSVRK